jgi:putative oxidoreductase
MGSIMLAHGYQKLSQDWGTTWAPFLSTTAQAAVAWAEVVGGCALILGLLTRLAAAGFIGILVPALYLVSPHREFLGSEIGEGAPALGYLKIGTEYHVALLMQCLALVLLGSGRLSLDHCLFRRRTRAGQVVTESVAPAVGKPHLDGAGAPAHDERIHR